MLAVRRVVLMAAWKAEKMVEKSVVTKAEKSVVEWAGKKVVKKVEQLVVRKVAHSVGYLAG